MVRVRSAATFSLIPPVVFFDALAWYAMLSMLTLFLVAPASDGGLELPIADAGTRHAVMRGVVMGSSLLGGLVAIGVGSHLVLVLGLATAFAGVVALGMCDTTTVWVAIVLAGAGQGMARPALYATAASAFGYPAEQVRNALFVTCWACFNLGAIFGPGAAYWAQSSLGFRSAFHLSGAVMILAMFCAAGLGIVALVRRDQPAPVPDTAHQFDGRVLLLAAGVALLALVPWSGYSVVTVLQIDFLHEAGTTLDYSTLFSINPAVVVLCSVLLVPVLLVLHAWRANVPTLTIVGVGLTLIGLGFVPMLVAPPDLALPAFIAATVIVSLGEVMTGPFLLSRLLGDHHWRLTALVAGVWFAACGLVTALLNSLAYADIPHLSSQLTAGAIACVAVIIGLVLAVAGVPLRKYLVPVGAEQAQEPAPTDLDAWGREEFGQG